MDGKPNNIQDIDVNSPEFYEKVQTEIECDMARMKKSVEVIINLRSKFAPIDINVLRTRLGVPNTHFVQINCTAIYSPYISVDLTFRSVDLCIPSGANNRESESNCEPGLEAAEIEVETAALFHAELWYDMIVIHNDSHENSGDEEYEETEKDTPTI